MRFVYVAGLEHSGTTLLSHLLSSHADALSLGEVAVFFSPALMQRYMARWGSYPDAQICSCGQPWENCEFWGAIVGLCGLRSDAPLAEKYARLLEHVAATRPRAIIVDSSKSAAYLETAILPLLSRSFRMEDFSVAFAAKDVRSFTMSIAARDQRSPSLWRNLRTFNWWLGVNRTYLRLFERTGIPTDFALYELLCADPDRCLMPIRQRHAIEATHQAHAAPSNSHIVLGNKAFLRRRNRVAYDHRWFLEDSLQLAYLLHRPARKFNRALYRLAGADLPGHAHSPA